jgi:hypothetical protein
MCLYVLVDSLCVVLCMSEERFKLQEAYDTGPVLGLNRKINGPSIKNNLVKIPPGLYGQPTETSVILEGMCLYILVDSLCVVLCMSHWSVVFHGHSYQLY